jgi:hypothetical protein
MTVTDTLHEPVKLARLPWTYLLGIVALAGYFWSSLSSVLTFTILTSASRRKPEAAERLPDFLHWPLAIEATFLLIVTILLVLWITFGLRLQHARPRCCRNPLAFRHAPAAGILDVCAWRTVVEHTGLYTGRA